MDKFFSFACGCAVLLALSGCTDTDTAEAEVLSQWSGATTTLPPDPPPPDEGECKVYCNGGTSGIHTYICCNPGDEHTCNEFQGGDNWKPGDYCDHTGSPTGGGEVCSGFPYEPATFPMPDYNPDFVSPHICDLPDDCDDACRNPWVCWEYAYCFSQCMRDQPGFWAVDWSMMCPGG